MATPTPIGPRDAPTRAVRLEQQVKQLAGRVEELEHTALALLEDREKLVAELGNCYDNLTELNFRLLFIMMKVQINRDIATGVVDAQGRSIVETRTETLFDNYRDQGQDFREGMRRHEQEAQREATSQQKPGHTPAHVPRDAPPARSLADVEADAAALVRGQAVARS